MTWHAPFLGICEYNQVSFQWQFSPELLAKPYLNNNKIHIKQHPLPPGRPSSFSSLCLGVLPMETFIT